MDIAQNLLNAVAALKSASAEIDDLFDEFDRVLASHSTGDGVTFRPMEKFAPDPDSFRAGWVQDAWRQTYMASERGSARKSVRHGELSLVADLGHSGWLAERCGKPYLYVFWAPSTDLWIDMIDTEGSSPSMQASMR